MNCHIPCKPSPGLSGFRETKCQRHLAKYCDINNMIQRALGGDASVYRSGAFLDVSTVPDTMQEMLNAQCRARDSYEMLPQEIRNRFPSPEAFLAALSNPDRKQELLRLGILVETKPDEPIKVSVVNSKPDDVSSDATADTTSAPAR